MANLAPFPSSSMHQKNKLRYTREQWSIEGTYEAFHVSEPSREHSMDHLLFSKADYGTENEKS
jgi:hypothetical protein